MNNKIIQHLKKREKKRISQLGTIEPISSISDYKKTQKIFEDDFLYYSSHEFFMPKINKKKIGLKHIPEWIAFLMIDITIKNWINNNKESSIKNIKILDPFCGSGVFTHIIIEYLFNVFKNYFPEDNDIHLLEHIIQNNIFSWDIHSDSIQICQNRIKNIFNIEPINVCIKNTLLQKNDFDIIIGNPPYGNLLSEDLKKEINSSFDNIAIDFTEWANNSTNKTNEVSLILPHVISSSKKYSSWKNSLYQNQKLYMYIELDNTLDNQMKNDIYFFNKKENNHVQHFDLNNSNTFHLQSN